MGTRGSFPGGKVTGTWSCHSPPSSAEVKEWVEPYFHSPNTPSWRGAQLKHRDNFTFYHNTTRRHNPEDIDLKHHRRENLKSRGNLFMLHLSLSWSRRTAMHLGKMCLSCADERGCHWPWRDTHRADNHISRFRHRFAIFWTISKKSLSVFPETLWCATKIVIP
jgi:hypothetical protein